MIYSPYKNSLKRVPFAQKIIERDAFRLVYTTSNRSLTYWMTRHVSHSKSRVKTILLERDRCDVIPKVA